MSLDVAVRGAEQFAEISQRLKQVGGGELRKELNRGLRLATKPLKSAVVRSARDTLPRRGGLADKVAKSKITVKRRASSRDVSIRLIASNSHDIKSMDKGILRKPLYGNRKHWYYQPVPAGWWTRPLQEDSPAVREEIVKVLADIKRKIEA